MSASTVGRRPGPGRLRGQQPGERGALTARAGEVAHARGCAGGRTLAERLDAALERLQAAGAADCPVCRGPLVPAGGGGRCGRCGSAVA
jgi:hypothetical protein